MLKCLSALLMMLASCLAQAVDYPAPTEDDTLLRDFQFRSGKSLPELRPEFAGELFVPSELLETSTPNG